MNLAGSPKLVASQLRKFLSSARIVASEVTDPVIWEAVCKDPSFSGLIETGAVASAYRARTQFLGRDRRDLTVYVFVNSLTLDIVVHFRTKNAMQTIVNNAVIQSVMES